MDELLTVSSEVRTERYNQNTSIILENIVSLIQSSLEGSSLEGYEAVVDQIKEKVNQEFATRLSQYQAEFGNLASDFFGKLVSVLQGANSVCANQDADCLSDLGAFLGGELNREEEELSQQNNEVSNEASQQVENALDEAVSNNEEPENVETDSGEENLNESSDNVDVSVSEESTDVAAPAEEVAVPAEEVAAPAEEVAVPAEEVAVPAEEVAVPAEEVAAPVAEATNVEVNNQDQTLDNTPAPAVAQGLAMRKAQRISKALYDEALRVYSKNRSSSHGNKSKRLSNLKAMPVF